MLLGTRNLYMAFIQTSKLFVFVPPNPTCLIQPMDWSAIDAWLLEEVMHRFGIGFSRF